MSAWMAWIRDLESKGKLKERGRPLDPGGRQLRGRNRLVTDGPFAEAKDIVRLHPGRGEGPGRGDGAGARVPDARRRRDGRDPSSGRNAELTEAPGAATAGRMGRVSQRQRPGPTGESGTTVVVALAANAGIAIAKLAAALLSGSSAMLAEAFHAMADTGNEVVLLVAQRASARPPDEDHPLGHGRAAYFWALIAALGVFVTGALLSIRQG